MFNLLEAPIKVVYDPAMHARLTIELGEGYPSVLDLEPAAPVNMGRSRDNTIILHDEHASRQHAQLFFADGQWHVRDLGTLNGTQVDGKKIAQPVLLQNNQVIGIADMRLRFRTDPAWPMLCPEPHGKAQTPAIATAKSGVTPLLADDLAILYDYVRATARESDPAIVVERTLETIMARTRATVCGFLNLDPDQPLPKKVLPQAADMNAQLSRQLTLRVQQTGKTVWLQAAAGEVGSSDSLASYVDALCVPVNAEGMPMGALHLYKSQENFGERDVRFCEMAAEFVANNLTRLRRYRTLEAENSRLRLRAPISEELIGASAAMAALRDMIARAAKSAATVLIHGETGVGKELVAESLHRQGPRCHGPLVVANCAAIADSLFESEMFGHCKGAFTGALAAHPGFFQQADDGTLFLDEIGDLPLECQVKLLRAIEGHPFRPVGSTRELRTDVRIVAASNKNLEEDVQSGRFRQDLFFRLRVIYIVVPPLRDHAEDIPALVDYFLDKLANPPGHAKKISAAALSLLQEYSWPGNVRQLWAVLESAATMGKTNPIEPEDVSLPDWLLAQHAGSLRLDDIEALAIKKAMEKTGGKIAQAAKLLGIDRGTLAKKLKHPGVE